MAWYAASGPRAARQAVADVAVAGWVVAAVLIGRAVTRSVVRTAEPVDAIAGQADGVAGELRRAADAAGRVPFVGGDLSSPITDAAGTTTGIGDSARNASATLHTVATVTGLLAGLVLAVGVVAVWAVLRVRFAVRSAAAARVAAGPDGAEVMALRALVTGPPRTLAAFGPQLVDRWRARDPATIAALARVARRQAGLPVSRR